MSDLYISDEELVAALRAGATIFMGEQYRQALSRSILSDNYDVDTHMWQGRMLAIEINHITLSTDKVRE